MLGSFLTLFGSIFDPPGPLLDNLAPFHNWVPLPSVCTIFDDFSARPNLAPGAFTSIKTVVF